jgi:nucleoside phosphorylase
MKTALKVLIVDDNGSKSQAIATVVNESNVAADVDTATTIAGARKAIAQIRYDLIILDILLPTRPGEPENADQCEGLLADIGKERRLQKPRALVGITAYESQYERAYSIFAAHGWLLFNFDTQRSTWSRVITERLRFLKETPDNAAQVPPFDADIAVVTALATPELTSVLEWPADWKIGRISNDYQEYHEGTFIVGDKSLRVIAATAQQMGLVAAASLSSKLCQAFHPKLIVMAGIAAGVRGRTYFGDVLVADESWDYNSGKLGKAGGNHVFQSDPKSIRIPPEISGVFGDPKRNEMLVDRAFSTWRGALPLQRPRVHLGPVASGSSVVASPEKVQEIQQQNRKLLGLEMETYGVYFSAVHAAMPKPRYLSMKAVCDFADDQKHDGYQTYAAHMSSQFLWQVINEGSLLAAL